MLIGCARALALGLACAWLGACSGDDGGDDMTGPAAGAGAAEGGGIDAYIDAYCGLVRRCCGAVGLPAEPLANCEADLGQQMDLVVAVRAGKTLLREPAFSACVQELADASCQLPQLSTGPCTEVLFDGTVPEGGACDDAVECQRGDGPPVCLRAGDTGGQPEQAGVCVALRSAPLGEPCLVDYFGRGGVTIGTPETSPPLAYCDRRDGLYCPPFGGVCTALPTQGEACDFDCADGLYCEEAGSTCQPRTTAGGACESSSQCAAGTLCTSGTCAAPSVADTELCEGDFD